MIKSKSIPQGLGYRIVNDEVRITGYSGSEPILNIPETINKRPVTSIAKKAFCDNQILVEVTLPNSISHLYSEAFRNCTNLKSVELPSDLTVINASCFENCIHLEHVQLPYELTRICTAAFKNCKMLTSLPHYSKTAIGGVLTVVRSMVETELPLRLEYIGNEAFMGCESLPCINIPHKVVQLSHDLFQGCTALSQVFLHANITSIGSGTFCGCKNLTSLRLPDGIRSIGSDSFDPATLLICDTDSVASRYAQSHGLNYRFTDGLLPPITSIMVPLEQTEDYHRFYNDEQANSILEQCSIRPIFANPPTPQSPTFGDSPCRFELRDGIYHQTAPRKNGHALIRMVGDLMCKAKCQNSAFVDGTYNFDECFRQVAPLLQEADLSIGNLETMSASSLPYTRERRYANDRPYLNAPNDFLFSVKKAGFDAVINAQNHVYDTGMYGILDTLDALNRAQLMHTGVYAGNQEKRFLSIVVGGIHIAILAYHDGVRQAMKKVYFSKYGLNNIFNIYSPQRVAADVQAARAEGAEFIIAYCHWGNEYTEIISPRQASFASTVANAGVDYIFGSHSHCPQPYTVLHTDDGRDVPVIYSGGNFLSEINQAPRITRNTFIASLELVRNEDGKVVIKEDGYYPCRILQYNDRRGAYVVVPTNSAVNLTSRMETLVNTERDITNTMGSAYKKLATRDLSANPALEHDCKYGKYTVGKPPIAEISSMITAKPASRYRRDNSNVYQLCDSGSSNNAVLHCVGQIQYDRTLGTRGRCDDQYFFHGNFHWVKEILQKSDLSIGALNAMVSPRYPTSDTDSSLPSGYRNAPRAYLEALKQAGFDCLAMAGSHNLDTGVAGIADTEMQISDSGMLSVGIGEENRKLFSIHGIRVGLLSYATLMPNTIGQITLQGLEKILSPYTTVRAKQDIAWMKEHGADFILSYIHCGSNYKLPLAQRRTLARELGDLGADYVICTVPKLVTKYEIHTTPDGRSVRIATALGDFMTGNFDSEQDLAAMLKITLHKDEDGTVSVTDEFIPMKQFKLLDGFSFPIVPQPSYRGSSQYEKYFADVTATLSKSLGHNISPSEE